MSASRPYYDGPEPPDPLLDAVYDSVAVMMAGSEDLTEGLVEVAELVTHSLPGADGAGVALMRGDEVVLRVGSSKLVDEADAIQYGLDEGPCLSAVAEARAIRTGSFREHEDRWPHFAPAVQQLGIGSMLSLPLRVRTEVIGSINIYALRGDGFLELDATNGERFALPVAAAIRSAQASRNLDHLATEMRETLEAKAAVSAAVTLLAERDGLPPRAALASLSDLAGQQQQSLVDAASTLLRPPVEEGPTS
ncbi:GAF domain-containing protein [uncultured Friedmanniella sp.]|uniref:GAF domain-containing protein n=1 Tax=uncultured Friedmanniella sp. TaxID=335381 RepID=UPI0035CB62E6